MYRVAIDKYLNDVRDDLIADQIAKNIKASGQSADSLQIKSDEQSGQLLGDDYFYYQAHGRKAGKFPPINSIISWIQQKGLSFEGKIESVAFVIARKIAERGTDIASGKRPALALDQIAEKHRTALAKSIGEQIQLMVIGVLKDASQ